MAEPSEHDLQRAYAWLKRTGAILAGDDFEVSEYKPLALEFAAHREQAERETIEACAKVAQDLLGTNIAERIRARGKP